jgi:hypothetical protein
MSTGDMGTISTTVCGWIAKFRGKRHQAPMKHDATLRIFISP